MHDLLLKNGRIIDGSGRPEFLADLGIKNGRISAFGTTPCMPADRVIDATGLVVAPGFIDIHTHSDLPLLEIPSADSKVMGGVTTEVLGNCGMSAAPLTVQEGQEIAQRLEGRGVEPWQTFGEYLDRLESRGLSINAAALVGHGTVRLKAMGWDNRPPSGRELDLMKGLVDEAMTSGAFGLSTGLAYTPGSNATTDEIVELARAAAAHGGFYTTHQRGEYEGFIEGVDEALEIGRRTGIPVHLSHHGPNKKPLWGQSRESIDLIESARAEGMDVTCDVIPYPGLVGRWNREAMLPEWVEQGGTQEALRKLSDGSTRRKIRSEMLSVENTPECGGAMFQKYGLWDMLVLCYCEGDDERQHLGRDMAEIADRSGLEPVDAFLDLLACPGEISFAFWFHHEDDFLHILRQPYTMPTSDGNVGRIPEDSSTYGLLRPRDFGTFAHFLETYVRQRCILSLEEAVRRATSLPASRLGLSDRGLIREGNWADLVIFDPDTISDTFRFEPRERIFKPSHPGGIEYVIVNGSAVVEGGKHTGLRAGKVLRRT